MRLVSFYYLTLISALSAFIFLPFWESSFAADRRTPVVIAVEKVGPAVVNINTSIRMTRNPFRTRNPLRDFFGRPSEGRAVERESLQAERIHHRFQVAYASVETEVRHFAF